MYSKILKDSAASMKAWESRSRAGGSLDSFGTETTGDYHRKHGSRAFSVDAAHAEKLTAMRNELKGKGFESVDLSDGGAPGDWMMQRGKESMYVEDHGKSFSVSISASLMPTKKIAKQADRLGMSVRFKK